MVKNLPAMQETWVRSLGQKDALEKEMATHSSILAGAIPWIEEPGGFSPWGCKELDTTEGLSTHTRKKRVTFPIPRKERIIFYFDVQKIGGEKKRCYSQSFPSQL